jgi:hypothetical protein
MSEQTEFYNGVTPVGWLTAGALFTPSDRGYQNSKLDNPRYFALVAIPKGSPKVGEIFSAMQLAAADCFKRGEQNNPKFSWKYYDGDKPEYAARERYPGNWIFRFTTGAEYPPTLVDANIQPILDQGRIKTGYQVRVAYSVRGNGQSGDTAGIYLNFNMLQLVQEDKIIVTGPDPSEIFGTPAQALPASIPTGPDAAPAPPQPYGQPNAAPAPPQPYGQPNAAPAPPQPYGQPNAAPAPPQPYGQPNAAPAPPQPYGQPNAAPAPPQGPVPNYQPDPSFLMPPGATS